MSRTESTERCLFGGNNTKIWVTQPQIILFEKGDVKFIVKVVEFDYDTVEDYVLLDISTNNPTELLQTGVKTFRQNELTKPIVALLCLDDRELLRRTQMHSARDVLLLHLMKTLQSFTTGV